MPIIFLLSAIVSGIALLIVMYVIVMKIRKAPLDHSCLRSMALWLVGFLCIDVILEGLEVFTMLYESEESWGIISQLITEKIAISYFGIQFILGSVLPLFILGGIEFGKLGEDVKPSIRVLAASLVLVGLFAMRWNVVIGGQLISKSLRGFTSYSPTLLGEGGILVASGLMLLPFLVFAVLVYLLPPWQEEVKLPERKKLAF